MVYILSSLLRKETIRSIHAHIVVPPLLGTSSSWIFHHKRIDLKAARDPTAAAGDFVGTDHK